MDRHEVYKRLLKKPSNIFYLPNSIVFLEEDFTNESDENTIKVKVNSGKQTLPSNVLNELLNNQAKYKVIEKFLSQNKKDKLYLFTIDKDGECTFQANFTKKGIAETLLNFIMEDTNTEQKKEKYEKIKSSISYASYINQIGNETVEYESFRGEYKIKKSALLRILELPQEALMSIIENDFIAGIPKAEFLKCTNIVLKDRNLTQEYIIPQNVHNNHTLLTKNIDAAITEFAKPEKMPYEKDIEINEMLWEEIWSTVPEYFNRLEKAYYIYHKLCKMLSYDEEAFINCLNPTTLEKHKISHLRNINQDTSEVLCFEFTAIYAKFLDALDIPYNIYGNEKYNRQDHSHIEFAYDDFYIIADSTKSLFEGDLVKAKNGQKNYTLSGFYLSPRHSESTKDKFEQALKRVKDYIKKEDQDINYESLISEYYAMTKKETPLSPEERLNLLLSFMDNIKLKPTDSMGYIHNLKKVLFCSSYEDNCSLIFIKDNNPPTYREKKEALAAVICYNKEIVKDSFFNDNQYFLYIPEEGSVPIEKEDLEQKFISKKLNLIQNNGYTEKNIPGINLIGGENVRKTSTVNKK